MMFCLEDLATIFLKENQEMIYSKVARSLTCYEAVEVMTPSEAGKTTTPFVADKEQIISSGIKARTD